MTRTQRFGSLLLLSVASFALAGGPTAAAAPKVLPFIQDDYAAALAKAREQKLPLFVEAWAPW